MDTHGSSTVMDPNAYSGADGTMTPEGLEMLSQLGVSADKIEELRHQMLQAEAIRGQQGPQGATAGGIYVAANPLEHAGSMVQKYQANKEIGGLRGQIGSQMDQIGQGRHAAMQALLRNAQPQGMGAQNPVMSMGAEALRGIQPGMMQKPPL
jgi:hypothetical protein